MQDRRVEVGQCIGAVPMLASAGARMAEVCKDDQVKDQCRTTLRCLVRHSSYLQNLPLGVLVLLLGQNDLLVPAMLQLYGALGIPLQAVWLGFFSSW